MRGAGRKSNDKRLWFQRSLQTDALITRSQRVWWIKIVSVYLLKRKATTAVGNDTSHCLVVDSRIIELQYSSCTFVHLCQLVEQCIFVLIKDVVTV